MGSATILVIDDELHIRQFLRAAFEFEGFTVQEARDAEEGIRSATLKPPDLIILDLGLPDRDGSSIIERLRSWSNTPIIVLTVRSREREKVRLLELGADDYVVKPFGIGELIARVRAVLRPRVVTPANDPVVKVGPLEINLATRSGTIDGKRLVLGPKEYLVLQILAQHAGKVVTRQQIMKQVWGGSHLDDTHYLRIVVRNLRKKTRSIRPGRASCRPNSGLDIALCGSGVGAMRPRTRIGASGNPTYTKFMRAVGEDTRGLTEPVPSFSPHS
jgi:two-component system KDP operon response regulator KdpE